MAVRCLWELDPFVHSHLSGYFFLHTFLLMSTTAGASWPFFASLPLWSYIFFWLTCVPLMPTLNMSMMNDVYCIRPFGTSHHSHQGIWQLFSHRITAYQFLNIEVYFPDTSCKYHFSKTLIAWITLIILRIVYCLHKQNPWLQMQHASGLIDKQSVTMWEIFLVRTLCFWIWQKLPVDAFRGLNCTCLEWQNFSM